MRNYNLFRRPDRAELVCAVPEDRPVPAFISAPSWEFVGRVNEGAIGSLSFNREAAHASVKFNGFYLFQLINASDLQLKLNEVGTSAGDMTTVGQTDFGRTAMASPPAPPLVRSQMRTVKIDGVFDRM